jgi:hypothetical protein
MRAAVGRDATQPCGRFAHFWYIVFSGMVEARLVAEKSLKMLGVWVVKTLTDTHDQIVQEWGPCSQAVFVIQQTPPLAQGQ